jgi:aspartyl-tRNA(Asn)/glutamyl-tRNA(Gln) amidotransferase subunit B
VREIIAENPAAIADYKKGKTASMQFLIGKAMGKLKGRARPEILKEIFEKLLI